MAKLDDKTTDRLFQTGAGRHDFAYDPAAWEQMEQLLDHDTAARRRRWAWLLLAGLLSLGLVGFWGYTQFGEQDANNVSPLTEQQPLTGGPIAGERNVAVVSSLSSSSLPDADSAPTDDQSGSEPATEPLPLPRKIEDDRVRPYNSRAITHQRERITRQNEAEATPSSQPVVPENSSPLTEGMVDVITALTERTSSHLSVVNRISADPVTLSLPQRLLPEVSPGEATAGRIEKQGLRPGLAITASAGLTSGMVEIGDFGPVDTRLGAKLDYRFSPKFSFGVGAYHSNVCYRVDGTAYKAAEGFWTDAIVPKDVLSDCDILEVPLSLTWHPKGSDQSGIYLGGGLTSYFLLTERFEFKYESTRTDLVSSWREDDTNRHLFGMGQINFGYQRKTSRKSAFQVESFIQLPLTGIGQGKVNLLTVGASVNYTFDFRRKR